MGAMYVCMYVRSSTDYRVERSRTSVVYICVYTYDWLANTILLPLLLSVCLCQYVYVCMCTYVCIHRYTSVSSRRRRQWHQSALWVWCGLVFLSTYLYTGHLFPWWWTLRPPSTSPIVFYSRWLRGERPCPMIQHNSLTCTLDTTTIKPLHCTIMLQNRLYTVRFKSLLLGSSASSQNSWYYYVLTSGRVIDLS